MTFWGFFYARNRLRALKNLQHASLTMKSFKKSYGDFGRNGGARISLYKVKTILYA
jgi:hypothetical protein